MKYLALCAFFIGLAYASPLVADCEVKYQGIFQSEVEAFLSIPYAQDTSGENRFKPPCPFVPKNRSTIQAIAAGPACPQNLGGPGALPLYLSIISEISEDCLHLNSYRPNGTKPEDNLPVLVHIHGGSFISSLKDEITIQPSGLILESIANGHPVMAVNIDYRLGV